MKAPSLAGVEPAVLEEGRARLTAVRERIARAADRAGRDPDEITLVGVAKKQPTERILAAIAAGVHTLGQSYVQEAREMRPRIEAALADDPAARDIRLEWRLVGQLQRNKAGLAARLFDAVESVDRPALVDTLARRAADEGKQLEVLIQVSLCGEDQKGGCQADDLPSLVARIREHESLRLRGLMTVPAAGNGPEDARPAFRRLRELRRELAAGDPSFAGAALSMGMSGDLEVAVEEGATLVRIGTALFGERLVPA